MKNLTIKYKIQLDTALTWKFNKATVLQTLIYERQKWYDNEVTKVLEFYRDHIFSVLSILPTELTLLDQFGLTMWSLILDLPLEKAISPDSPNKPVFGFNWQPGWKKNQNFYYANFANTNIQPGVSLVHQQLLLRLRYFNLTTRCDIFSINSILSKIFIDGTGVTGPVYAIDTYKMKMHYIFGSIPQTLRNLLLDYDILPRPATVEVKIYSNVTKLFGFGLKNQNFSHGCFAGY